MKFPLISNFFFVFVFFRGQKKEIIVDLPIYAEYPRVTLKYLDFHCNFNVYPSTFQQFQIYSEEIQLEYFLGAILSISFDLKYFLFPEEPLENPNHLYLIGISPAASIEWIKYLQSESLFDDSSSFPNISMDLKDFLVTFNDSSQSFIQTGKLYLNSILHRYSNQIIGIGPIGLDYSDLIQKESHSIEQQQEEEEAEEIKRIRWIQSLVLYLQILTFIEHLNSPSEQKNLGEIDQFEDKEIGIINLPQPPPPLSAAVNEDRKVSGEDEEEEENEEGELEKEIENKQELSIEDPLLLLSYHSITSQQQSQSQTTSRSSSKFILLTINGQLNSSTYHLTDLLTILSILYPSQLQPQEQQTNKPYLLIQLNPSLNYRTIQFLLSKYSQVYFTVDGRITHTKQKILREYLYDIPLERLVIESNGPLYPPVSPPSYSEFPLPPLLNSTLTYHPGYLLVIASTIATVKRILDINSVLEVCWENTCKILGLK